MEVVTPLYLKGIYNGKTVAIKVFPNNRQYGPDRGMEYSILISSKGVLYPQPIAQIQIVDPLGNEYPAYVMEYIDGQTLGLYKGTLPDAVIQNALSKLQNQIDRGLKRGDIKTDNIIVVQDANGKATGIRLIDPLPMAADAKDPVGTLRGILENYAEPARTIQEEQTVKKSTTKTTEATTKTITQEPVKTNARLIALPKWMQNIKSTQLAKSILNVLDKGIALGHKTWYSRILNATPIGFDRPEAVGIGQNIFETTAWYVTRLSPIVPIFIRIPLLVYDAARFARTAYIQPELVTPMLVRGALAGIISVVGGMVIAPLIAPVLLPAGNLIKMVQQFLGPGNAFIYNLTNLLFSITNPKNVVTFLAFTTIFQFHPLAGISQAIINRLPAVIPVTRTAKPESRPVSGSLLSNVWNNISTRFSGQFTSSVQQQVHDYFFGDEIDAELEAWRTQTGRQVPKLDGNGNQIGTETEDQFASRRREYKDAMDVWYDAPDDVKVNIVKAHFSNVTDPKLDTYIREAIEDQDKGETTQTTTEPKQTTTNKQSLLPDGVTVEFVGSSKRFGGLTGKGIRPIHAVIARKGQMVAIASADPSKGAVRVNGVEADAGGILLSAGDIVEIGDLTLAVTEKNGAIGFTDDEGTPVRVKGNTNYQADTAERAAAYAGIAAGLRARAIGAGMGAAAGVWLGGLPTVIGIVIGQLPAVYNRTSVPLMLWQQTRNAPKTPLFSADIFTAPIVTEVNQSAPIPAGNEETSRSISETKQVPSDMQIVSEIPVQTEAEQQKYSILQLMFQSVSDWLTSDDNVEKGFGNGQAFTMTNMFYRTLAQNAIDAFNRALGRPEYSLDTPMSELGQTALTVLETLFTKDGIVFFGEKNTIEFDHPQKFITDLFSAQKLFYNSKGVRVSVEEYIQDRYKNLINRGMSIQLQDLDPEVVLEKVRNGTSWADAEFRIRYPDRYKDFLNSMNLDESTIQILKEQGIQISTIVIKTVEGREYFIPILNNPMKLQGAYGVFAHYDSPSDGLMDAGWVNIKASSIYDPSDGKTNFLDAFSTIFHEIDHSIYRASTTSRFRHIFQERNSQERELSQLVNDALQKSDSIDMSILSSRYNALLRIRDDIFAFRPDNSSAQLENNAQEQRNTAEIISIRELIVNTAFGYQSAEAKRIH